MYGNSKPMTEQDKQWRAESDADAIARYLEIMQDDERVKMATAYAQKRLDELQKRTEIMRKVANKKGAKKNGK